MNRAPADQNLVKQMNCSLILDQLLAVSPQSRAHLAEQTGLNRSTISSLVSELIELGLIRELGLEEVSSRGRPGILLELNPAGGCIIGVEITPERVTVILTDFTAHTLWRRQVDVNGVSQPDILIQAEELIDAARRAGTANNLPLLGIGLGITGLVDTANGILKYSPPLGWRNVDFRQMWGHKYGVPLYIENDGNASALGEHYFGIAKGCRDFLYLGTGVGLAGGLMLNGQLYRGATGYAGEVGHIIVESGSEMCSCGRRGCWETLVGPRAVKDGIIQALKRGAPSIIPSLVGSHYERINMQIVVEAANRGDQLARDTLADVALHLGTGIANLINLFNPSLIVLGGTLILGGDYLLGTVSSIIAAEALQEPQREVALALAALGTDSSVKGAVALVIDGIVREPVSC